jgi:hypothetical protein
MVNTESELRGFIIKLSALRQIQSYKSGLKQRRYFAELTVHMHMSSRPTALEFCHPNELMNSYNKTWSWKNKEA